MSLPLANMVTAFQMTSICMLMLGNWVIGLIEAEVIARALKYRPAYLRTKCVFANYVTTTLGVFVAAWIGTSNHALNEFSLYHPLVALAVLILGTFVITVAVEWPIMAWLAPIEGARRSFGLVGLANLVTYSTVIPAIFLMTSDPSLISWKLKPGAEMAPLPGYSILYVSAVDDTTIWRVDLAHPGESSYWGHRLTEAQVVWGAVYQSNDADAVGVLGAGSFVPPLPEDVVLNVRHFPPSERWLGYAGKGGPGPDYLDLRTTPSDVDVNQTHSRRGAEFARHGQVFATLVCDSALVPHTIWPEGTVIDGDLAVVGFSDHVCVADPHTMTLYDLGPGKWPLIQMSPAIIASTTRPATRP